HLLFFLLLLPTPRSTLFPYTTLFRSRSGGYLPDQGVDLSRGRGSHPGSRSTGKRCRSCRPRGPRGVGSHCLRSLLGIGRRAAKADRKSTRLNSSHVAISYAVFCLKKK